MRKGMGERKKRERKKKKKKKKKKGKGRENKHSSRGGVEVERRLLRISSSLSCPSLEQS